MFGDQGSSRREDLNFASKRNRKRAVNINKNDSLPKQNRLTNTGDTGSQLDKETANRQICNRRYGENSSHSTDKKSRYDSSDSDSNVSKEQTSVNYSVAKHQQDFTKNNDSFENMKIEMNQRTVNDKVDEITSEEEKIINDSDLAPDQVFYNDIEF